MRAHFIAETSFPPLLPNLSKLQLISNHNWWFQVNLLLRPKFLMTKFYLSDVRSARPHNLFISFVLLRDQHSHYWWSSHDCCHRALMRYSAVNCDTGRNTFAVETVFSVLLGGLQLSRVWRLRTGGRTPPDWVLVSPDCGAPLYAARLTLPHSTLPCKPSDQLQ